MVDVIKTMIVTTSVVDLAKSIGEQIGVAATGMWVTPCCPKEGGLVSHYISHGPIAEQFAVMLESTENLFVGLTAMSIPITFEQCTFIMANADVSDAGWEAALDRMGLKLMTEEII
jgi:hypothetical protein